MRKLVVYGITLFNAAAFAGSMGEIGTRTTMVPVVKGCQPVITLSVGPVWGGYDDTQTFAVQPDVIKTYDGKSSSSAFGTGEIFFGIEAPVYGQISGQLGLAAAFAGDAKLDGDIWEDADPNFNNYYYSYKINHGRIALKGKLLADYGYWAQPYVSGSFGIGFNHAFNFGITPKIYEEVPHPPFTSNTRHGFSYTLGLGLQKPISECWILGVGYEFADWGKSELGRASYQTINNGIYLPHYYTNELQFSLTYLA